MKIGYINYLNCLPFYYHMFEKEPIEGVSVVPGIPEELNRMMRDGVLDMSPVSAAAYPGMQDRTLVLPQFALSSVGYVRSVILISRLPIEELGGKKVGLTTASKTSVNLLKVLLEKHYKLKPEYVPIKPGPDLGDVDAALVIGNDAMMDGSMRKGSAPVPYIYDLGDLWLRHTGHPVVFAVFTVQEAFFGSHHDQVRQVVSSYRRSLEELRTNEGEVVSVAARRYPEVKYDISHYYELLKFDFTRELKDAVEYYFSECASLGFLEPVSKLRFADV